jgi:hypothetical protein
MNTRAPVLHRNNDTKQWGSNQRFEQFIKYVEGKQDANQTEVQAEMELETYEMEMEIDWPDGGEREWKRNTHSTEVIVQSGTGLDRIGLIVAEPSLYGLGFMSRRHHGTKLSMDRAVL